MTVDVGGLVSGAPRLVVATREDVLNKLPPEMLDVDPQPVLEAAADCLLAMALEHQRAAGTCAAGVDPDRAEDEELRGVAEDRSATQADGEDPELFRARFLGIQASASNEAIAAAVNAILAPWTTKTCGLLEALDQWFVHDADNDIYPGTGTDETVDWHSFLGEQAQYPDRLYESDAALNGGEFIESRGGTGAHVFGATTVRTFVILLPSLALIRAAPISATSVTATARHIFIGRTSFISSPGGDALAIYRAIEAKVRELVGHSVSFSILEDTGL
jgi:hypothetical protein